MGNYSSIFGYVWGSTLDDYEVLGHIGEGGHGCCDKVRHKSDGKIFVWKTIKSSVSQRMLDRHPNLQEKLMQQLTNEVNCLRSLSSPYIVRYHDHLFNGEKNMAYIVMEYCPGGDLYDYIKFKRESDTVTPEDFVWTVLIELILALDECHRIKSDRKSILHRDVKSKNIFLDANENVKLGDFGVSRELIEGNMASTFCGTQIYMAPEIHKKRPYTEKCDIWSLGCVLHELCTRQHPFLSGRSTIETVVSNIANGKITSPIAKKLYSSELIKIIGKMLQVEEAKRPSAAQFLTSSEVKKHMAQLEKKKRFRFTTV